MFPLSLPPSPSEAIIIFCRIPIRENINQERKKDCAKRKGGGGRLLRKGEKWGFELIKNSRGRSRGGESKFRPTHLCPLACSCILGKHALIPTAKKGQAKNRVQLTEEKLWNSAEELPEQRKNGRKIEYGNTSVFFLLLFFASSMLWLWLTQNMRHGHRGGGARNERRRRRKEYFSLVSFPSFPSRLTDLHNTTPNPVRLSSSASYPAGNHASSSWLASGRLLLGVGLLGCKKLTVNEKGEHSCYICYRVFVTMTT